MSEKKKVFISGPMSGIKDFNKPAFDKAEEYLTNAGYSVFNPARMHFDESWDHSEIMKIDLAALAQCDYILLLDKWYYSKGAIQERSYAIATGVELLSMSDIERSKKETKPTKRIEIETFGDISEPNLKFLQWVQQHCNEILAKGGDLTEGVEVQIDNTTEHILRMMAFLNANSVYGLNPERKQRPRIKACYTCAHHGVSILEEPCKPCYEYSNWEPKEDELKSCVRCKHYTCSLNEEPCKSCEPLPIHNNWEPKEEKQTDWGDDSCGHLLK